tara:strand:+ start:275 stop:472 length:198 start_codon:yes stop_codon:yes gene_type:complete
MKTATITATKDELWAIHWAFTTLGTLFETHAESLVVEGDPEALDLWGKSVVTLGEKMGEALKELK